MGLIKREHRSPKNKTQIHSAKASNHTQLAKGLINCYRLVPPPIGEDDKAGGHARRSAGGGG